MVEVFLLGAGRPAQGAQPAALKRLMPHARALDWQIAGFKENLPDAHIRFLGGYHADDIMHQYPDLDITVMPQWETYGPLQTLLRAPFNAQTPAIFSYADTIFRPQIIADLCAQAHGADVVFAYDSLWQERYANRPQSSLEKSETLNVSGIEAEFTGLIYINPKALETLKKAQDMPNKARLVDLIPFFAAQNLTLKGIDAAGHWAEFDMPQDIARFVLGTKAETLARLETMVRKSHIGKQVAFTTTQWQQSPNDILAQITDTFADTPLVIRSSSKSEDSWHASNAGGFDSLLNVKPNDTASAINTVSASYGAKAQGQDQVLVQAFLQDTALSGVLFTCGLETGAPYYRFNFDDVSGSTESVTAGTGNDLRTIIIARNATTQSVNRIAPTIAPVLEAVRELEDLLGYAKLDIEFAIDKKGQVHIFQVRPITVEHSVFEDTHSAIRPAIDAARERFKTYNAPSPFIHGNETIFGNMPDWNPAEIIGTRPKPLSFSLYRHLITDEVWACQRAQYGYRDVRPHPLIVSFGGQPYVDVRASLNSFIPASLPDDVAARIANAYIALLRDNPASHDKIEFDIAFTIWTPDFAKAAKARLSPYGVTQNDIALLEDALKTLTQNALERLSNDIASAQTLGPRRAAIKASNLNELDKAYALLDDCKRFGTLAFSHAARAGFVGITLLKALVNQKIFTPERYNAFLQSVHTVAKDFETDKYACHKGQQTLEALTQKYGHLRPGTYEASTPAYWENPLQYINPDTATAPVHAAPFTLTASEAAGIDALMAELGSKGDHVQFLSYARQAIEAREAIKFEFTRNLSLALDYIVQWASARGIDRNDTSFMEYSDIDRIRANMLEHDTLLKLIKQRKTTYRITQQIELPPLIAHEHDFDCFEQSASMPNFVTTKRIEAPLHVLTTHTPEGLAGNIVLIPQADPGYDWLFGHNIAGLITQYGGANSHMAIRSAEIGLPAAIGVGDKLFENISRMRDVELDCANRIIRQAGL